MFPLSRAFQEVFAEEFQKDNPHLEFTITNRPSRHPYLEAIYRKALLLISLLLSILLSDNCFASRPDI